MVHIDLTDSVRNQSNRLYSINFQAKGESTAGVEFNLRDFYCKNAGADPTTTLRLR